MGDGDGDISAAVEARKQMTHRSIAAGVRPEEEGEQSTQIESVTKYVHLLKIAVVECLLHKYCTTSLPWRRDRRGLTSPICEEKTSSWRHEQGARRHMLSTWTRAHARGRQFIQNHDRDLNSTDLGAPMG
uniref:Uncharacterized protein n=1 Tax=Steinernema glaseri TaxID=37863 RepID=A0A1I7Z036_9BILA